MFKRFKIKKAVNELIATSAEVLTNGGSLTVIIKKDDGAKTVNFTLESFIDPETRKLTIAPFVRLFEENPGAQVQLINKDSKRILVDELSGKIKE